MLLPAKDYFKVLESALEKGLGADNVDEMFEGKALFFIDDSLYGDDLSKELKIFTKDFVLNIEMTIDLGDTFKDSGEWSKDYYATNVSSQYPDTYEDKFNNDYIAKWFKDNWFNLI